MALARRAFIPRQRGAECLAWVEHVMPYEGLIERSKAQSPENMLSPLDHAVYGFHPNVHIQATYEQTWCRERKLLVCVFRSIFLESWEVFEGGGDLSMSAYAAAFTGPHIRWDDVDTVHVLCAGKRLLQIPLAYTLQDLSARSSSLVRETGDGG